MADVQPFCGLRYNPELISDLSAVISPPYDVISPEEQLFYYSKSLHNVIRLELGQEHAGDSEQFNKYSRAAVTLEDWTREGALFIEESPAFYLVEHRFPYRDGFKTRLGLLARVRLEELDGGWIRPHEITMKEPAADRMRLLRSCRATFSPIMGIFRGESPGISPFLAELSQQREPHQTATDSYGVTYRLWVIADTEAINGISDFFTRKIIYIADGHHRYETALRYAREQRVLNFGCSRSAPFNFTMMSLMDSEDPGLIMLPTHRLVKRLEAATLKRVKDKLGIYFNVREESPAPSVSHFDALNGWLETLQRWGALGKTVFGVYGLEPKRFHILIPRYEAVLSETLPRDKPLAWKELDVSLLHWVVLPASLGIDNPEKEKEHLEYTRDGAEALARVDSGDCQLAFFLNPAAVSSVLAVADAGARMPQKSTYFYPKTPAGLVINSLDVP